MLQVHDRVMIDVSDVVRTGYPEWVSVAAQQCTFDTYLDALIDELEEESTAMLRLLEFVGKIQTSAIDEGRARTGEEISSLLLAVGQRLIRDFRFHGMYRNGICNYKFAGRQEPALILLKYQQGAIAWTMENT